MSMELVLFDLDDTLVRTTDLERFRGAANAERQPPNYVAELTRAFLGGFSRHYYARSHLDELRRQTPAIKIGVFTRAPRVYAMTLLGLAYPGFEWDVVVAYGDVPRTKPHGDGIWHAMAQCGVTEHYKVVMVGDNKVDVQAAYNAGCWAVLDRASWSSPWVREQYWALERVPDAFISSPAELLRFTQDPLEFLPELERAGWATGPLPQVRYRDARASYFNPLTPDVNRPVPIHFMGRFFTQESPNRAGWHRLNQEVIQLKESLDYPRHWISSICAFLDSLPIIQFDGAVALTVVPAKPGRLPRLESMLAQLAASREWSPNVEFIPDLMSYRQGVRSHSGEHLNREQRFQNVRDCLIVNNGARVAGKPVIVIDDVVTTGASLIYSKIMLEVAGASEVICLSMAKAINGQ